MANENSVGPVRVVEDSTGIYELWVGDDRFPSLGPTSRTAMGIDAPFTLVGTLTATTNYPSLVVQVTDLEGNALSGRKRLSVFPHTGAFVAIAVTHISAASGVITSTTTAAEPTYYTDANGALSVKFGTGAAKDNFACAISCGHVYGAASAISVT